MHPALDLLVKNSLDAPVDVKRQIIVDLIVEKTIKNENATIAFINRLERLIYGKEKFRKSINDSFSNRHAFVNSLKINEVFSKVIEEILLYEDGRVIQDFLYALSRTKWTYTPPPIDPNFTKPELTLM